MPEVIADEVVEFTCPKMTTTFKAKNPPVVQLPTGEFVYRVPCPSQPDKTEDNSWTPTCALKFTDNLAYVRHLKRMGKIPLARTVAEEEAFVEQELLKHQTVETTGVYDAMDGSEKNQPGCNDADPNAWCDSTVYVT